MSNDYTFYLNNGTVNEGYLHSDGKSLNGYGINRLCKNLCLPVRHDVTDVTRRGLTHLKSRKNVPMSSTMAPPLMMNVHLGQHRNQRQYEGDTVGQNHRCHFCFEPGHTSGACSHGKPIQCKNVLGWAINQSSV